MQFHADPASGTLEAGSETDIVLSFAPDAPHRWVATHTLTASCDFSLLAVVAAADTSILCVN